MNIWFFIAYLILGFIGLVIIGYVLLDKIMRKEVGENYMDESREEECEKVEADYDAHFDKLCLHVSQGKRIFFMILIWLSWPVSVPIFMHRIKTTNIFEDTLKFF